MKNLLLILFLTKPLLSFNIKQNQIIKSEETPKKSFGLDISHYQTNIKYNQLDVDFVIIKKSEGVTISDNMFNQHFNNIKTLKGCYHFFRPECDGVEQAKFFLSGLSIDKLDIIPIIDVEICSTWKRYKTTGVKNLNKFITYIEDSVGCKPIIYTSPHFWNDFVDTNFNCLLWVADYREFDEPEIPCGFDSWVVWQQTNKHKINAINGYVDFNVCYDIEKIKLK